METRKFTVEEFQQALQTLDDRLGENPFVVAFAPIRIISPGGFAAISYFKNRATTEDIDFIIDPEWSRDEDIEPYIRKTAKAVGNDLGFGVKWINDDVSLFVSRDAKKELFEKALAQNIVLWGGQNLTVLAAPLEWGLETKLRRLHTKPDHPKAATDLGDVMVILRLLRDKKGGKLDREQIRTMNTNGFDSLPGFHTMELVAEEYKKKFGEDIFED
ncbi:hypothetical protein FQN54_000053 [Arachnomyces sp. PD_36]|nr:hypothetical protein FQN54_000053 [Arachnomyces sp. PD_36]